MAEVIVMPDTEKVVCDFVRSALAARTETYTNDVYVGVEVPDDKRSRMVIVTRQAGRTASVVKDQPFVRFWIWANSHKEVTDLTNMVRALLPSMADGKPVLLVKENSGPSPVPDASISQHQRLMTYEIYLRGTAV